MNLIKYKIGEGNLRIKSYKKGKIIKLHEIKRTLTRVNWRCLSFSYTYSLTYHIIYVSSYLSYRYSVTI